MHDACVLTRPYVHVYVCVLAIFRSHAQFIHIQAYIQEYDTYMNVDKKIRGVNGK